MYYIYFSYVGILASFMLYECQKKKQPKWWAAMVLMAPIVTPYFIFKSRQESGIVLFMIFLTTFSAVAASETFIFVNHLEKTRYAHLSPMARQMIRLSEDLKVSTLKLDSALVKLEDLSKVESRLHEMKKTIEFIDQLKIIMKENQDAINRLVKYTEDYEEFFNSKDLEWVFNIQKFYHNRNVVLHHDSLEKYLFSFQELLKYTHANFLNITKLKSEAHLRNYDEYYLRYRRAVDSHNRFNVRRIEFQNSYIEEYPDIKAFLPGKRQTEAFRLWG